MFDCRRYCRLARVPQFLIVVDPASDDSITYLRNAIENVPDRVPTLVVTCPHAVSPTGADKVKSLCADVEVEAFEVNPRVGENNVAEVFQYAAMHAPTPYAQLVYCCHCLSCMSARV